MIGVDKEGWRATLAYWLECGIAFRSGDCLEFPARVKIATPDWPTVTTVAQPQTENWRSSTPVALPSARQERWTQPESVATTASPNKKTANSHTAPLPPKNRPSQPDRLLLPAVPSAEKPDMFAKMAGEVATCTKCVLAKTRNKTVFGAGTTDTPVVFVGEGPGADEDLQGEPFVGAAGQLLEQMLRAISLQRSQVYIANVVKCRPPGNRNPNTDEISACQDYLFQQLEIIRPKVIFCLGKFALLCLTGYTDPVGSARDKPLSWRGIPVIASYHPAYYLRSPGRKSAAWEDLLRLTKLLEHLSDQNK